MKSTDNRVYNQEPNGCSPGCGTIAGIIFFGFFFGTLAFLDSGYDKQNTSTAPKKELMTNVDTCAKLKDSMRVYKVR